MSNKLNYIGTIRKSVDIEDFRDAVSSYVRNRGSLVNISGVDDNSFVTEAKPDMMGCLYGLKATFTLIPKDGKTNLEVRGKMHVTGMGWIWWIFHIVLAFSTAGVWSIVLIIIALKSAKVTKNFFNDIVTDAKNMM